MIRFFKSTLFCFLFLMAGCSPVREHPYFCYELSISPDGRYAALSKIDHTVSVFDLEKRKIILHQDYSPYIPSFCFSSDSKYLMILSEGSKIYFFDLESKKYFKEMETPNKDSITAMKMFKDGKRAVVGTYYGAVYIWNMETGEQQLLKKSYTTDSAIDDVRMVDISPDETKILSVMSETTNPKYPLNGHFIWDVATLKPIGKIKVMHGITKGFGKFSPDGKKVVISNESGFNHVADANTGKQIHGPKFVYVESGIPMEKGEPVFTDENFNSYKINSTTGQPDFSKPIKHGLLSNDRCSASGLGFIENGKYFVTSWPAESDIALWDTEKYKIIGRSIKLKKQICFGAFATNPEKNLIVTGDNDGSITVYKFDPKDLTIKVIWRPHPPKAGDITWINPVTAMGQTRETVQKMGEALQQDNDYRRNWRWWNPVTWFRGKLK